MNAELGYAGVFTLMNGGYMQDAREAMGGSCQVTPYADHVFRLAAFNYRRTALGQDYIKFPKAVADSVLGKYGLNPGYINPDLYRQSQVEMMRDQM